jgi:hypothetical protein
MATRFREFDWGSTPLGPVERWPESWRNAVNIILDSSFPTALGLGDELIYFYNDAFIPLAGPSRHPPGRRSGHRSSSRDSSTRSVPAYLPARPIC